MERDYNRQRLYPRPGDVFYIHLSDILLFIDAYRNTSFEQVLDFGCGGSPYRELFKASRYIRADYVDCGGLDFMISSEGKVPLPNGSCNAVLSTQVLEHVFSPPIYLREAARVLAPGGKLILTTHGIWEDHGCPYDFWRWTADGLRRELTEAGFCVNRLVKLTTGPRAALFLAGEYASRIRGARSRLARLITAVLSRASCASTVLRDRFLDLLLQEHRIADASSAGHDLYLALGAEAQKVG